MNVVKVPCLGKQFKLGLDLWSCLVKPDCLFIYLRATLVILVLYVFLNSQI